MQKKFFPNEEEIPSREEEFKKEREEFLEKHGNEFATEEEAEKAFLDGGLW